jgi:hypothetical protein
MSVDWRNLKSSIACGQAAQGQKKAAWDDESAHTKKKRTTIAFSAEILHETQLGVKTGVKGLFSVEILHKTQQG